MNVKSLSNNRVGRPLQETPNNIDRQYLRAIAEQMTIREIADQVGVNSPATVHQRIGKLQRMGYVTQKPFGWRCYRLTFKGEQEIEYEGEATRRRIESITDAFLTGKALLSRDFD